MNPSEYEIQREVEALRDLRRRSTTPGALVIDPDLPAQPVPSSPLEAHPISQPPTDSQQSLTDDPFHLFWVPADVHPEIAPAEFRAFLKEHAHGSPSGTVSRSSSLSSSSPASSSSSSSAAALGRKKSMLRNQYSASENDNLEDESAVPLRRNRSSLYASQSPQLTINDLRKIEELAEEASESHDATRLRNILRRSLSLNISPTSIESMQDVPEMGDEADAPIIVPPPGLILRRAARTKIRKPGLPGDGGGHRFASRRGPSSRALERRPSDVSSSDHSEASGSQEVSPQPIPRSHTLPTEATARPDSFSDVYDAYATDEDEDIPQDVPKLVTEPHGLSLHDESPLQSPIQPELLDALGPVLHQPQPQSYTAPSSPPRDTSRSPSPVESPAQEIPYQIRSPSPPAQQIAESSFTPHLPSSYLPPSALNAAAPQQGRKDKDKKSLFGKGGKKGVKEKEKEREGRSTEKSGFFGSLFGKKKHDEPVPVSSGAGREAAQALLGVSKSSKSRAPSPVPPGSPLAGSDNWSRFPIHVERAIYRLSHIKLANPRRPLYEQVLISNLMFWYLGVINNKTPQPGAGGANEQATPGNGASSGQTDGSGAGDGTTDVDAEAEALENEREARRKEEAERAEREKEREREPKKKETGKRGSLTKSVPVGQGNRRHEMPVKGPSYEMQHRVMEQESGGYSTPQSARSSPSPSGSGNSQYQQRSEQFYYSPDSTPQSQVQQRLPPGAMPPLDTSSWMTQQQQQPQQKSPAGIHSKSPPPISPDRRSPPGAYGTMPDATAGGAGNRIAGRSVSATAVPAGSPPLANGKPRKGNSVTAVAPHSYSGVGGRRGNPQPRNGMGEEEDVPLAVWQQQRRK